MPCGRGCQKVLIDCTSSPAKLAILRDMIIADIINGKDAIHDFGVMGMKIDDLVAEYVANHVSE